MAKLASKSNLNKRLCFFGSVLTFFTSKWRRSRGSALNLSNHKDKVNCLQSMQCRKFDTHKHFILYTFYSSAEFNGGETT